MKMTHPYYYTWAHQPEGIPFPVERAEHDEFILDDGRRVYDFLSTSFQSNFGHSHPAIRESMKRQLDIMPIASPKASFDLKERVSHRLLEYLQLPEGRLFYTVSGSESVENALKMARQMTQRKTVLARRKSYHGASLGALSVTGDWRNEPHLTLNEYTLRIPEPSDDPDLAETRRIVATRGAENIAAVIVETISGANGVCIPTQTWFDHLQAMCREFGILLIVDEVLCGFGRTGSDFAFQAYKIEPDFVCMSKGITGGYIPFGAVWTSASVGRFYDAQLLACGLTSYAHPLGLAALDAVLDLMTDAEFAAERLVLESTLKDACNNIAEWDTVADVRCLGLLAAIDLPGEAIPSGDTFFDHGLHLYSKNNSVIVAPPFVSTPARLSQAMDVLQQVLARGR